MSRHRRTAAVFAALTAVASLLAGTAAGAAVVPPKLRLITTTDTARADRYDGPRSTAHATLPLFIGVDDADLKLKATRAGYDKPIVLQQVLSNGSTKALKLALDWPGLSKALSVEVRDAANALVFTTEVDWCPTGGYDAVRTGPTAVEKNPYPLQCASHPFTRGQIWGMPAGWAADPHAGFAINVPDGTYHATLIVNDKVAKDLNFTGPTSHTYTLTVGPAPFAALARKPGTAPAAPKRPKGKPTVSPDPTTVPNLVALPALWVGTDHTVDTNRDLLTFGATVWNAGPGPLTVDGFRRGNQPLMDAYQNFYKNGTKVGYSPVGTFEYDARIGHEHWHFTDFAAYRLLDTGGRLITPSGKEAFCLAPTDGIDLTVPGATWQPQFGTGFSQCGDVNSISIRESMPVGWGDTYYQTIPGQSFDITSVPNGTYQIEVVANQLNKLLESTTADNRALRTVTLGGAPGRRTATAAPYLGIVG
jgi:hypothetical protein